MPPSMRLSRDLFVRGITYKLQEQAYGGLSAATARKLEQAGANSLSRRLGYTRAADLLEAGHAARAGVARGPAHCAPNLKPSSKTKSPKGGSAIKSFAAVPL